MEGPMAIKIARREFISALGGAAVVWPLKALAEQPAMPVVGLLSSASPNAFGEGVAAFRRGVNENGFIEGRNVAFEYRWADGQYDRLPALAADLVGRKVFVIATAGGIPPALAAKAATTTIPIVFIMGSDPVKAGVVASLNRPEGNITGVSFLINSLGTKRVEVLCQLVPRASTIRILMNPTNPDAETDLEAASATLIEQGAGPLAVAGDPFVESRRGQVIALAARHMMPAIYPIREDPAAGGLMSYGTSISDAFRQGGVYVGRILKGAKSADLPVIQAVKFEFVINLKTAKALKLEVPPTFLSITDEVIE